MRVLETKLDGVYLFEPRVFHDGRGFFMESYNERVMEELGFRFRFVQDNHSLSVAAGTIRGLHYQEEPMAQTKLVRVIRGAIYDVAVDLRKDSPTFGNWVGVILSAENYRQILIPKGFAHGFCTLVGNTEVLYKVDQFYSPEHDKGIRWNDPEIGIDWPVSDPILSEKDMKHPFLREVEKLF